MKTTNLFIDLDLMNRELMSKKQQQEEQQMEFVF